MDAKSLLKNGAPLIDVRSEDEFRSGHVEGSVNIPLQTIPGEIEKIKTMGEPLVLCCLSGGRSGQAVEFLKQNGFKDVYNAGGWMQANAMKHGE